MTRSNPYELGLDKNEANFVALSPLSFIERSASVYPDRTATIYGSRRQTWRDTYARCRRLASGLVQRGIGAGDTVAAMLPNVPAMFEAHFGVPMTGAVLNTLNTRLDAEAIAFMLQHGEAKVLLTDREFSGVIEQGTGDARRQAAVRDRSRGRGRTGRQAARRRVVRILPRRRRRRLRLEAARRRMERDRAELHLGHDRQPQGRGDASPRRLPERSFECRDLGDAAPLGLPVDAADVPLQRLVLPVDDGPAGRRQRVPAQGRHRR